MNFFETLNFGAQQLKKNEQESEKTQNMKTVALIFLYNFYVYIN